MKKGYKSITMQDIATQLKISKNAVSIALSDKPGVSDELRKTIIETAEQMGYKLSAKTNKNTNNTILLVTPDYIADDKYFYYEIYWEIEKVAKKRGFQVEIYKLTYKEQQELTLPESINEQYSGVIIVGVVNLSYAKKLVNEVRNVVCVDNYYEELEADYVLTNNINGTYKAVEYLIAHGHTEIGFIGAKDSTASLYDRWSGYQKGMAKNNLTINEAYCITPNSELSNLLNGIEELRPYIERLEYMPTAWITGNDRVAFALINILTEKGFEVPREVSVIGFDDIEFSSLFNPPLTTLSVPREKLAREAVRVIISKINRKYEIKKREYCTELIERKSVCKIKK